jgi:hypothetical protein
MLQASFMPYGLRKPHYLQEPAITGNGAPLLLQAPFLNLAILSHRYVVLRWA